ncbi:MAG: hypothetical protein LCH60_06135 [Actinobacteria bacterium]|nr:hypothetical protein [Actinomycetota bacterium]
MSSGTTDARPGRVARPGRLHWAVSPLVAWTPVLGAVWLRNKATIECDVGINTGAAMVGTFAAAILLLIGLPLAGEPIRRLTTWPIALLAVIVISSVAALWLLSWSAPPVGYPVSVDTCPRDHPLWWPTWLPA